jgi:hypothetical protein
VQSHSHTLLQSYLLSAHIHFHILAVPNVHTPRRRKYYNDAPLAVVHIQDPDPVANDNNAILNVIDIDLLSSHRERSDIATHNASSCPSHNIARDEKHIVLVHAIHTSVNTPQRSRFRVDSNSHTAIRSTDPTFVLHRTSVALTLSVARSFTRRSFLHIPILLALTVPLFILHSSS